MHSSDLLKIAIVDKFEDFLVLLSSLFFLSFKRINSNLLIVLFKSGKILPGFAKFTLLHTFSNVPDLVQVL